MVKLYTRIVWENFPSRKSAVNETNMNIMDAAIDGLDNRIIALDTTKANVDDLDNLITGWSIDEHTGIITITKVDGSQIVFDLNLEKIPVSFTLSSDGILTMTTDDGTQFTANIASMIPILTFNDSSEIAVSVSGTGKDKTYSFSIKNNSITEAKLQPQFLADCRTASASASASAGSAASSASDAEDNALLAQSYAVGTGGARQGESTDNAKYYKEQADADASSASTSATNAASSEARARNYANDASNSASTATTAASTATTQADAASTSATNASSSASAASSSASDASLSAANAATAANRAEDVVDLVESYAVGGTGTRQGEDTDNAKYYKEQAESFKNTAQASATAAGTSESNAQSYASSASTSATNADASATAAATSESNAGDSATAAASSASSAGTSANTATTKASEASTSASNASTYATQAESYAKGGTNSRQGEDTDNAKYYYEQAQTIAQGLAGGLKPIGTVTFANLPSLSDAQAGWMYNISDAFTTTSDFEDGAGRYVGAGANVYKTAGGKWDVLAGTTVSGIKGDAETTYRTGNVNITKENIGLGNVPNVSTDNQTPTISESSTRTNLESGDTLATIISKIKKFFADLKTVAFTGSYNDLSNKPSIPSAANNGLLTIQKNGAQLGTFGADQAGNSTVNITVPTKVSDLTNDSGFEQNVQADWNVTDSTSDAFIKNKPTVPAAANNGVLTIQRNGTSLGTFSANQSTNKTINIVVPVNTSDLTNDSNFATKPTVVAYTILAANWSGTTYTFSNYSASLYDIEIFSNDSMTEEQYVAFSDARIVGGASSNTIKALGTVPTVNIPVLLRVSRK